MKRAILTITLLLGAALAAAAQTISASVAPVKRGGTSTGTVILTIPPGFHVNSNRPNTENLIPTSIRITAGGGKIYGLRYPAGKNKIFAFSDEPLNVYEGRVRFTFRLQIPRGFRRNRATVRIAADFQPCTDEVCYPQKTRRIILSVRVK
ncbi:MAG: hypothetical protein IPN69_03575 [Acidobacteria bacterium]|nr:hypothetical protein [Acidobacteriota bacterium]